MLDMVIEFFAMQPSQKPAFVSGVVWGLLSLWLFFGGLAFAEQLNMLNETSGEDEEVLFELASVLKSDDTSGDGKLTRNSVTITFTCVPLLVQETGGSRSPTNGLHDHSALRPHQRVSVYRI